MWLSHATVTQPWVMRWRLPAAQLSKSQASARIAALVATSRHAAVAHASVGTPIRWSASSPGSGVRNWRARRAQMTNCILMDHVVIHDKVTMQNSIVCGNVEVREGACLKDAQVASGVTIEAGAVHKNETVAAGEREDEGEAED